MVGSINWYLLIEYFYISGSGKFIVWFYFNDASCL